MERTPEKGITRDRVVSANLFPSKKMTPQQVGLLSAAVPSPFGDALGLLADGIGYAQDPKSLTWGRGALSLLGLAPGIPSMAMFAGPLAKTANLSALEKAKAMARLGRSDDAIWKETGWWLKTPDGIPRFEGPDGIEAFKKAYPDSGVAFKEAPPGGGNYNKFTKTVEHSDGNLEHEIQHAVQHKEGMSQGVGRGTANSVTKSDIDAVKADLNAPDVQAKIAENKELWGSSQLSDRDFADLAADRAYFWQAGEAEARAVQSRRNLTAAQRKKIFPWESYDVPIKSLLLSK